MGVANPIEWLLPPVAITHEAVGVVTQIVDAGAGTKLTRAIESPRSVKSLLSPDAPTPQAPPTLGTPITPPQPQNAQQETDARRRAEEARSRLGTSTRASDQLTGSLG